MPIAKHRRLGICLDDYGLHGAVNDAAVTLAQKGCLSAISCLTDAPQWSSGAAIIVQCAGLREQLDIGLHLNLTLDADGVERESRLPRLILAAYAGQLSEHDLRARIRRQLDRFEDALGARPDHIDGHRHVHQLPQIRHVLLDELCRRYPYRLPWLRNTSAPRGQSLRMTWKQRLIATLGARTTTRLAQAKGVVQNPRLLGVYAFSDIAVPYESRLKQWLDVAEDRDLLIAHAATAALPADPIAIARVREFNAMDRSLSELLAQRNIRVLRPSSFLALMDSNAMASAANAASS